MFRNLLSKTRNSKSMSNEKLPTEKISENLDQASAATTGRNKNDSDLAILAATEQTTECVDETTENGTQVLQCSIKGDLKTTLPLEGQSLETSDTNHKDLITKEKEEKTESTEVSNKQLDVSENASDLKPGGISEEKTETESSQLCCQPCKEKKESRDAEIWCTICHDSLCGSCNSHHAVFKATRNHIIIKIEEYQDILSVLKDTSNVCPEHPEMIMEKFCVQHNQPICNSYQINNHQGCETKQIDEIIGVSQHILDFDQSFERMNNSIRFLTEMSDNRSSAKATLLDMHERFLDNLKVNRRAINDWLDKVENEARMQFENIYLSEKDKIEKQRHEMELMRREIQKRLEIGNKLAPFKENPTVQMFLAMLQVTNNSVKEYENLKKAQDSFYNVAIDGNISFEVMEPEKSIKINNNFQFIHDPCNIRICDKQRDETPCDHIDYKHEKKQKKPIEDDEINRSSSVVEEECQSEVNTLFDKANKTENINYDDASDSSWTDVDSEISSSDTSSSYEYKLSHSFYVQRRVSEIDLVDVTILPNGELAILETSTPRLLIYAKDGKGKRGQVSLFDKPSCLTLYRNKKVAVTLPKLQKVAIIDTLTLTLDSYIEVHDECHGVCMTNVHLVVSCVNHGLKLIDGRKTIRRAIPKLKGRLFICNGGGGNVFTMREDSKMVVRYNINNGRRSNFHVGGSYKPRGIAVNHKGDLLFTCSETDEVYRKEDAAMSSESIISDGIRDPSKISYDKEINEIVVINNDGKSLSTYEFA